MAKRIKKRKSRRGGKSGYSEMMEHQHGGQQPARPGSWTGTLGGKRRGRRSNTPGQSRDTSIRRAARRGF